MDYFRRNGSERGFSRMRARTAREGQAFGEAAGGVTVSGAAFAGFL